MADGPRCLVFGGSGALGRVVCETLAAEGARVALTYRSRETVARELLASAPGSLAFPLELASVCSVEQVIDAAASALGGLDGFVQCAGVAVTTRRRGGGPVGPPRLGAGGEG